MYLLVRAVLEPGGRGTRTEYASIAFPGIGDEDQRRRVRDALSRMRALPGALAEMLKVDGEVIWLDLTGWAVDAADLIAWARDQTGPLPAVGDEKFLPSWEDVARIAEGKGAGPAFIEGTRDRLDRIRRRPDAPGVEEAVSA
jgi:hypothetical protein